MKKDTLCVYSGGLDSTVMLHAYKNQIALAVTFNYGSNHARKEIECAKKNCEALNIEHLIIPLDFMKQYFNSSLLQGADAIPEGHYEAENMKSTVVPFRNGIMLSIAIGLAESRGLQYVAIANHSGDHAIYPDCTKEFIDSMDCASKSGTYNKVKILSPFNGLRKHDIVALGFNALNVDFNNTWSCYKGGELHCGKCGTCVERKEAFEIMGLTDPTIYEQ